MSFVPLEKRPKTALQESEFFLQLGALLLVFEELAFQIVFLFLSLFDQSLHFVVLVQQIVVFLLQGVNQQLFFESLLLENELVIPQIRDPRLTLVEFESLNQLSINFLQVVNGVLLISDFLLLLMNLGLHLAHLELCGSFALSLAGKLIELLQQVDAEVQLGGLLGEFEGLVRSHEGVHLRTVGFAVLREAVVFRRSVSLLQDFLRKVKTFFLGLLFGILLGQLHY